MEREQVGIRLLGPVELWPGTDAPAPLSGAKRRAVLGLLAYDLGRCVPVERFYALLWGDEPPAQAKAALQGHVAALRKLLVDSPFDLLTRQPGYQLIGDPRTVDALWFRRLADRARTLPDDRSAAASCQEALGLWRGAALADLPDTELRASLATELNEVRVGVLTEWAERELRLGSGASAIPALEQCVRADGLREPAVVALIRCLHQAGRASDAVAAYHEARGRLDEELGIVPGAALQQAFSDVLSGQPVAAPTPQATIGLALSALVEREGREARQGQEPDEPDAYGSPGPVRTTAGPGPVTEAAPDEGTAGAVPAADTDGDGDGDGDGDTVDGSPGHDAPAGPDGTEAQHAPETARADTGTGTGVRTGTGDGDPHTRLPRRPPGFVGRGAETRWLDRACGPDGIGSRCAIVAGAAGSGKSSLVVQWARDTAARFADGCLFADLRGFDPAGATDPADALGQLLYGLGVHGAALPEEFEDRAALYREHTRDRRLLVVLDNAASSRHVADLLPAGADCSVVITSRNSLEDLIVTEGATLLHLDALPHPDALRMLEQLLTEQRVRQEPDAARRLVGLCDRLPLALRIVASRLAARPGWSLADLVEELEDEQTRLITLDTQGTTGVRTALSVTYRNLTGDAARLLALLAVHPGAEVAATSAAALLGSDIGRARDALGSLAAYHLLNESAPGRYGRHDLVRLYGAELLESEPPETGPTAFARLLDYYLAAVGRVSAIVQPGPEIHEPLAHPPRALPRTPDVRTALAWFEVEEPVIRALVEQAADRGEHERAWRLAHVASRGYLSTGRLSHRLNCMRAGLRAARTSGTTRAVATLEACTADALSDCGRHAEGLALARRAVERTTPADGNAHIHALIAQCMALFHGGDRAAASAVSDQALGLVRTTGLTEYAARVYNNAIGFKGMAGEHEESLLLAREARDILREHPHSSYYLMAMFNEGVTLMALGRLTEAEAAIRDVEEQCRAAGSPQMLAEFTWVYANTLKERGHPEAALRRLREALAMFADLGDTIKVERMTGLLAEWERAAGAAEGRAVRTEADGPDVRIASEERAVRTESDGQALRPAGTEAEAEAGAAAGAAPEATAMTGTASATTTEAGTTSGATADAGA
ncbi:BTAD domain-containing putative transcriptional regulator [Streptomyces sp. NPDC090025]|uniref:AfsR/SARP family transcriptional regulator n=1 Tax=Streptomyces sp. NPDC090025 TaxID=3365922 RepID=UPI0038370F79